MKPLTSIRATLLLSITLFLLAFLLAAMVGLYLYQKDVLTRQLIREATAISKVMKMGLKRQMLERNPELIQSDVAEIRDNANVAAAFIIDTAGMVKFSSQPLQVGKKFSRDDEQCRVCHDDRERQPSLTVRMADGAGKTVLRTVTLINNEAACLKCHPASQRILGLLFVDYFTRETDSLIAAMIWRLFLTALATLLLIALVIFYVTNRWLREPIKLLVDGANEIKKGRYEKQIAFEGQTEFKALADAFNEMAQSVRDNIKELHGKSFELAALYAIVKKISETIYLGDLKAVVIDLLLEILSVDRCVVITPTLENDTYEVLEKESGTEHRKTIIKGSDRQDLSLLLGRQVAEPFAEWVAQEVHAPALSADALFAYAPLAIRAHRLGLVIIERKAGRPLDAEGFRLFGAVKEHLAVAFENARLYTLAITDELTRLFTVRYFQSQLEMEISRYLRTGQKCSILMLDLDRFKAVNDRYGHPAGDEVLKVIGAIIKDSLREIDIPCRYGGEEFAVILPGASEKSGRIVAERVRANLEKSEIVLDNGARISVTVSIGGASCPENGIGVKETVTAADQALYAAKQAGRNSVIWNK